ncbi:MAG TPA: class I SAM-dependent methyltransferase [Terriglobales bacterium]|nr:class I SAM-dependent methyltransferase [Terriglobales bacterium]
MLPTQIKKQKVTPAVCPGIANPSRALRQPFTRTPKFRSWAAWIFQMCQRFGVSVTPTHFYWPIPDLRALSQKDWTACSLSEGVKLQLERQVQMLDADLLAFRVECNFPEGATDCDYQFHFNNGFFEHVDAEIAYAMVRHFQPSRIVEIGSGNSTRLLAAAMCRNREQGAPGELISIDPHADRVVIRGFPGLTRLISRPLQHVPMDVFTKLGPGDILFIDSSHVVMIDSDVVHECLRVLPKLKPGVVIHFHDIFIPFDYPQKFVMTNLCFWGEQYLLEAFLSYNRAFEVLWASSAMQLFHRDQLEKYLPSWNDSFLRMPDAMRVFTPTLDGKNVWPCSFWVQKVAD